MSGKSIYFEASKPAAWVHQCIRRYQSQGLGKEEAQQRCYGAWHKRHPGRSTREVSECCDDEKQIVQDPEALAAFYQEIVDDIGQWSQDDATYLTESFNPEITCANCRFFSEGACELVEGEIAPDGICELWIDGGEVSSKQTQTGAMIALFIPNDISEQLFNLAQQIDGLEPSPIGEHHVTLVYLGETADLHEDAEEALGLLCSNAAGISPTITGKINGIGKFVESHMEGKSAIYMNFDTPTLPPLRTRLVEGAQELGLLGEQVHGFTPHITLGYIDQSANDDSLPAFDAIETSVEFLTLALGESHSEFPFLGLGQKEVALGDLDIPTEPGLHVIKGDDGLRKLFLITSNSYKDREGEYITTEALKEYVDGLYAGDDFTGEQDLLFGHKGAAIGKIVWADVVGPFLVELAEERDIPYARRKWDQIEDSPDDWGASHAFEFKLSDLDGDTYKRIEKFETTVLPIERAANVLTFAGITGVIKAMSNRLKLLRRHLRISPEAEKELEEHLLGMASILGIEGINHKELDEEKQEDEEEEPMQEEEQQAVASAEDLAPTILEGLVAAFGEIELPEGINMQDIAMALADRVAEVVAMATEEEREVADSAELEAKELEVRERMLKLMDTLMDEQESIGGEMHRIAETFKALETLKVLPEKVKALETTVTALNKQLRGRPAASVDAEETNLDVALEAAKQAEAQIADERVLLPGTSIKVSRDYAEKTLKANHG